MPGSGEPLWPIAAREAKPTELRSAVKGQVSLTLSQFESLAHVNRTELLQYNKNTLAMVRSVTCYTCNCAM